VNDSPRVLKLRELLAQRLQATEASEKMRVEQQIAAVLRELSSPPREGRST
jgi:hypothetical protein